MWTKNVNSKNKTELNISIALRNIFNFHTKIFTQLKNSGGKKVNTKMLITNKYFQVSRGNVIKCYLK